MLIKSKFFYISSVIFLAIALSTIWFAYPPLLKQYSDNKEKAVSLDDEIAQKQKALDTLNLLATQKDQIDHFYQLANQALPSSSNSELLMLELDGLLSNLNLTGVTSTVPIGKSSTTSTPASSTPSSPSTGGDTSKPASMGGSTSPSVVSDAKTDLSFTLTGDMSLDSMKTLLVRLRNLSRWNKITSLSITTSADKMNISITSQVFTKGSTNLNFSGNSTFMQKAQSIFGSIQSYSTTPDITKEGTYGRANPFDAVK